LNSVRSVKKACHTSDFLLTSYHPESKNLVNLKYKKGHNSGKNFRKKKSSLSNKQGEITLILLRFGTKKIILVRKDIDVNEHERLSNSTFKKQINNKGTAL